MKDAPPITEIVHSCLSFSDHHTAIRGNQVELGANVLCTCLAAVTGITTMFAMLYVARKDAFGGVDRVERLKEVILKVGCFCSSSQTGVPASLPSPPIPTTECAL